MFFLRTVKQPAGLEPPSELSLLERVRARLSEPSLYEQLRLLINCELQRHFKLANQQWLNGYYNPNIKLRARMPFTYVRYVKWVNSLKEKIKESPKGIYPLKSQSVKDLANFFSQTKKEFIQRNNQYAMAFFNTLNDVVDREYSLLRQVASDQNALQALMTSHQYKKLFSWSDAQFLFQENKLVFCQVVVGRGLYQLVSNITIGNENYLNEKICKEIVSCKAPCQQKIALSRIVTNKKHGLPLDAVLPFDLEMDRCLPEVDRYQLRDSDLTVLIEKIIFEHGPYLINHLDPISDNGELFCLMPFPVWHSHPFHNSYMEELENRVHLSIAHNSAESCVQKAIVCGVMHIHGGHYIAFFIYAKAVTLSMHFIDPSPQESASHQFKDEFIKNFKTNFILYRQTKKRAPIKDISVNESYITQQLDVNSCGYMAIQTVLDVIVSRKIGYPVLTIQNQSISIDVNRLSISGSPLSWPEKERYYYSKDLFEKSMQVRQGITNELSNVTRVRYYTFPENFFGEYLAHGEDVAYNFREEVSKQVEEDTGLSTKKVVMDYFQKTKILEGIKQRCQKDRVVLTWPEVLDILGGEENFVFSIREYAKERLSRVSSTKGTGSYYLLKRISRGLEDILGAVAQVINIEVGEFLKNIFSSLMRKQYKLFEDASIFLRVTAGDSFIQETCRQLNEMHHQYVRDCLLNTILRGIDSLQNKLLYVQKEIIEKLERFLSKDHEKADFLSGLSVYQQVERNLDEQDQKIRAISSVNHISSQESGLFITTDKYIFDAIALLESFVLGQLASNPFTKETLSEYDEERFFALSFMGKEKRKHCEDMHNIDNAELKGQPLIYLLSLPTGMVNAKKFVLQSGFQLDLSHPTENRLINDDEYVGIRTYLENCWPNKEITKRMACADVVSKNLTDLKDNPIVTIPKERYFRSDFGYVFDVQQLLATFTIESGFINPYTNNRFSDRDLRCLGEHPTVGKQMERMWMLRENARKPKSEHARLFKQIKGCYSEQSKLVHLYQLENGQIFDVIDKNFNLEAMLNKGSFVNGEKEKLEDFVASVHNEENSVAKSVDSP